MKKTIITVSILTVIMVFFCASTFAATEEPRVIQRKQFINTDTNGITIYLNALQMQANVEGENNHGYVSVYISGYISNTTDDYKYMTYPDLSVQMDDTYISGLYPVEGLINYSNDLYLVVNDEINESYKFQIVSSSLWSYAGGFVIPPHIDLPLVAEIRFHADIQSSTYHYDWLQSISVPIDYYAMTTGVRTEGDLLYTNNLMASGFSGVNSGLSAINGSLGTLHNDVNTVNGNVNDIKSILQSNQGTNSNISNDSSSLKSQSDTVHQQEQAFFNQNSQAITQTGLSNYRFDNNQADGVAVASVLFTNLWNSLGGWTSVYILSLTLSLALMIIRHAPSTVGKIRRKSENE